MESPRSSSPLKLKPLRLPEQSLDEAMEKLLWDELGPPLLFALICIILADFEWIYVWRPRLWPTTFATPARILALSEPTLYVFAADLHGGSSIPPPRHVISHIIGDPLASISTRVAGTGDRRPTINQ